MRAMSVGDDDTIASSLPSLSGGQSDVAEVVAGRYSIVRWLGGGGMGRVYEARDTELDERVALKVLRAGLSEEAIARFRREVRLTRRIQHANVARMFDIGEHAGDKFLTMELVEGGPLTRELGAPMPWARLQSIATQICAGLAAAHAQGVVHRDLKPDNVLIERKTDRAVITDFGIARSTDDASVTQVGAVIGTPRYMAPEQLAGSDVDHRADLFSLGVMLYELASGARPWVGDNPIAVAVAQATQTPKPLSGPNIPAGYEAIVLRCLDLDRERRPASATEVADMLAHLAPPEGGRMTPRPRSSTRAPFTMSPTPNPTLSNVSEETTIAVLPLACAPDDAYIAEGMLEDVIDTLSGTQSLRVRPAGTARAQGDVDPRAVGRDLEVDHVVAGSIRRTKTGLRIAARLISVADGFQIWAQRIDCTEAEVLNVADQIATGVATALSTRAAVNTEAIDPRAVDLYLRGRAELRRFWGEHMVAGADLLQQAAAYAPGSPQILSTLAYATVQAWIRDGDAELRRRAYEAVERAMATGYGEAFHASALLALNNGDLEAAAAQLGTALARTPMAAQTHETVGRVLIEVDSVAEGRHHLETAVGLAPGRTQIVNADLTRLDVYDGNWAAAQRRIDRLTSDPDASVAQLGTVIQIRLALWRRDIPFVLANAARLATRAGPEVAAMSRVLTGFLNTRTVDAELWPRMVSRRIDPARPHRFQLITAQRLIEAALVVEQPDDALQVLAHTSEMGLLDIVWLDHMPLFEAVRGDMRFLAIRAEVADRAARVLAAFRASSR